MAGYEVETISVDGRTTALGSAGAFTLVWTGRSRREAPARGSMAGSS